MKDLATSLIEYVEQGIVPMHMPGHKRNFEGFPRDCYEFDVTEVPGTDNLHHPTGILKEAKERLAKAYGSDESYYLVNGSTVGLLAAISASCQRNETILVSRNCHKSVYNAIRLLNLHAVYLYPELDEEGMHRGITKQQVAEAYKKHKGAAIVITSPTYEGIVSEVKEIAGFAHEHKVPLIVDEAHGAHFRWSEKFPISAVECGADVVVQSLHKTLPSLTQTAILHLNSQYVSRESIEDFLSIYETSSPSYVLMASIDRCICYLLTSGKDAYKAYFERLSRLEDRLRKLRALTFYEPEGKDRSKIVIGTSHTTITGAELGTMLRENDRIEVEMTQPNYILCITSPFDTEEGFEALAAALERIDRGLSRTDNEAEFFPPIPLEAPLTATEALEREGEIIPIQEGDGRIAREYTYLYPPGIPFLVPGERITREMIRQIETYNRAGFTVAGTGISVVKEWRNNMSKLYVIMGKSATGKDTIFHELLKKCPDLNTVVTYTTRPIRAGEMHGREYFFVTQDEMYEMEAQERIIECREYDTVHGPWFYFTADDGQIDFSKGNYVMISTLEGYERLQVSLGKECVEPIYIEVDDFVRIERALARERQQTVPCVPEVCRRFLADEEDFKAEKLVEAGILKGISNVTVEKALEDICEKYGFVEK